jgi:hypothetical protein
MLGTYFGVGEQTHSWRTHSLYHTTAFYSFGDCSGRVFCRLAAPRYPVICFICYDDSLRRSFSEIFGESWPNLGAEPRYLVTIDCPVVTLHDTRPARREGA